MIGQLCFVAERAAGQKTLAVGMGLFTDAGGNYIGIAANLIFVNLMLGIKVKEPHKLIRKWTEDDQP